VSIIGIEQPEIQANCGFASLADKAASGHGGDAPAFEQKGIIVGDGRRS